MRSVGILRRIQVQAQLQESWTVPIFLCPRLGKSPSAFSSPVYQKLNSFKSPERLYSSLKATTTSLPNEAPFTTAPVSSKEIIAPARLPWTCPGCGAYTQNVSPDEAGYYSPTRKSVRTFLGKLASSNGELRTDDPVLTSSTRGVSGAAIDDAKSQEQLNAKKEVNHSVPVCDRCHQLLHHSKGVSIVHPAISSIQDIISESPYKYNHIYHVLDAADYPLSLIPQLQQYLALMPLRGQNRRSKTDKYYHGRKTEMSFIITRSDLLAPKKEQVNTLMPYLVNVLRDALGSSGRNVRLGNVRCVSSKRGWWTTQLKEEIWRRGGGGWLVGKVNVGKSSLFDAVFPKGRQEIRFEALRESAGHIPNYKSTSPEPEDTDIPATEDADSGELFGSSLLPPAPEEVAFPMMPIVSSLPGTTASPIRLPFGKGRGELIDLPGLSRGNLEHYVLDERKHDLVMEHRIKAEQVVMKPGQSLLIGGLFRITPTDPNAVLLVSPFVPLQCHVTSTDKAIGMHTQHLSTGVPSIAVAGAGEKMASAGVFQLKWDVTKKRAGPLTDRSAVGLKAQVLPFVIFSADIIIEGCGWVEVAIEVRKRALEAAAASGSGVDGMTEFPLVEVFSPEGKHVAVRQPINAWMLGGLRPLSVSKRKARPRRSMKGVKKNLKKANLAMQAQVVSSTV